VFLVFKSRLFIASNVGLLKTMPASCYPKNNGRLWIKESVWLQPPKTEVQLNYLTANRSLADLDEAAITVDRVLNANSVSSITIDQAL